MPPAPRFRPMIRSTVVERHETAFCRKDLLPVDAVIPGPALIVQTDTVASVPSGCTFKLLDSGIIEIDLPIEPD